MNKFFEVYRIAGCFIPLVVMVITDALSIDSKITNFIWMILLILNIILIIYAFRKYKITKISEKICVLIGLIILIGYTIYFVLHQFLYSIL